MEAGPDEECRILAGNWREDPHVSGASRKALGEAFDETPNDLRSAFDRLPGVVWFDESGGHPKSAALPERLSRITLGSRFAVRHDERSRHRRAGAGRVRSSAGLQQQLRRRQDSRNSQPRSGTRLDFRANPGRV